MILAIDTATRQASVALYDAAGVAAEQTWRTANNHSAEVMPALMALLAQQRLELAVLEGVAVAQGPGSFTGLRIGLSLAKGLCLAIGCPIIAVPSLDVTAYAAGERGCPVWAVLEVGRGRLCAAEYGFEEGAPVRRGAPQLAHAQEWAPVVTGPVRLAGEVSLALRERLQSGPDAGWITIASPASGLRRAGFLAELAWRRLAAGQADDLDSLEPLYLFTH